MALKKGVSIMVFGEEFNIPNAYIAITNVYGNKEFVNIDVTFYKDETKEHILFVNNYEFVPSSEDFAFRWDKQAYEYLKTLDEFIDAVDC